ncbi:hypothetical protein QBC31_42065 [Streptomyces sp. B21-079]|uniref:hypothetical protein n=1 Tax=Streptomyces sp. B21-079 TaxID=3039409 RepID=UPI002FF14B4C
MDDQGERAASALTGLRSRIQDAVARSGLSLDQLVAKSGLSRTTLHAALREGGSVPSARTVATLAEKLELPVQELLRLRRVASGVRPDDTSAGPGRPIGQFDPHDLEVHPAGPREWGLPRYVGRAHDEVLKTAVAEAAEGSSSLLVLVGSSSTGKTRACWEAIQPLKAHGWRLWHPFDPTRAEAALAALRQVGPHTVVWLNEAQHYLGAGSGELIAAALHTLLTDPERGPVLVLGTLWPEYAEAYTAVPRPGQPDPHTRVRELLAGRLRAVPAEFDNAAATLAKTFAAAGDKLLAQAVSHARDGRLPQVLAGAPQLLQRHANASPGARAVLEAAMDARRLGIGLYLPMLFLSEAAEDYFGDDDFDRLSDDWFEQALAELGAPVHGDLAPLRGVRRRRSDRPPVGLDESPPQGPAYRLADYLEQHGRESRRRLCPPASFWEAVHRNIVSSDDLAQVAQAAYSRHRTQWAHRLRCKAAFAGDMGAMSWLLAEYEKAGDHHGADALLQRATASGDPNVLVWLSVRREAAGDHVRAEALAVEAAHAGDTRGLIRLGCSREQAGDQSEAEAYFRRAVDLGDVQALRHLARLEEEAGDHGAAEVLVEQAAAAGDRSAATWFADFRARSRSFKASEEARRTAPELTTTATVVRSVEAKETGGDHEAAQALALEAAERGDCEALLWLARWRSRRDDQRAVPLYERAAAAGDGGALIWLAGRSQEAGDVRQAESLYLRAAQAGIADALHDLARMHEEAGDSDKAEELARRAAEGTKTSWHSHLPGDYCHHLGFQESSTGDPLEPLYDAAVTWVRSTRTLLWLVRRRFDAGDHDRAEHLARQVAGFGNIVVWFYLARMHEEAADYAQAERLFRRASEQSNSDVAPTLVRLREKSGDQEQAEELAVRCLAARKPAALLWLAYRRDDSDDYEAAERLVLLAAEAGAPNLLRHLVMRRGTAGKVEAAERLAVRAADAGRLLYDLADVLRDKKEDSIPALLQRAADNGNVGALCSLAELEEKSGRHERAEFLALQAADAGNTSALEELAKGREVAGDRRGAERCALQAADAGNSAVIVWLSRKRKDATAEHNGRLWPYGLDPDGSATTAW